ncbi:TonB-dependent hemin, ferrichrome receptor [Klebsiella pneumoniae]|nr:TonB-dependent hemin, ferrichrome receptor [Klebsiella pneumoniae]
MCRRTSTPFIRRKTAIKPNIYGVRLALNLNFGTWFEQVDGLSATLALGYSEGKSKSSYSGDKIRRPSTAWAPMKAIVGVAWDESGRKRYGTALTATFVKGKQATAPTAKATATADPPSPMPAATICACRATACWTGPRTGRWAKNVRLNGGVYNLTDRK